MLTKSRILFHVPPNRTKRYLTLASSMSKKKYNQFLFKCGYILNMLLNEDQRDFIEFMYRHLSESLSMLLYHIITYILSLL